MFEHRLNQTLLIIATYIVDKPRTSKSGNMVYGPLALVALV